MLASFHAVRGRFYTLQAFAANYIESNGSDGRPRRLIVDDFGMYLFSVPYTLH